jgi:SAM-dependent methyltransferase
MQMLDADDQLEFIRDISSDDQMHMSRPEVYYRFGLTALAYIKLALRAAGQREPKTILDLPSGYGRVLRMLKAAFADARITACDIDRPAVDYCVSKFGAVPCYSTEEPEKIDLPAGFDLIWCGSLLTHLDVDRWRGFLALFEQQLSANGVAIFTVNGRTIADDIRSGKRKFGIGDHRRLLRRYARGGFGFEPYTHSAGGYGISLSSPSFVWKGLEQHPGLKLLMYTEGGWNGRQDTVACVPRQSGVAN